MHKIRFLIYFMAAVLVLTSFTAGRAYALTSTQIVDTIIGEIQQGSNTGGGNVKFYCQYGAVNDKGRLSDRDYWNRNSCDITGTGCGPTSIAMIMTTLGEDIKPYEVAFANNRMGCGDPNSYYYDTKTSHIIGPVTDWLRGKGYKVTGNLVSNGQLNTKAVNEFLDNGYFILGGADMRYMLSSGYSDHFAGHAFVISGHGGSSDSFAAYDPTFCEGVGFGGERKIEDVNNSSLTGKDNIQHWFFAVGIKK